MVKGPTFWRAILLAAAVTGVSLVGAVLFFFDPSRHGFYPTCLFHQATGLWCPGCGSLRACHQLLHGHFSAAFHYNALLVISLPVAAWAGTVYAWRKMHHHPVSPAISAKWIWLVLGIALAFAIWRNVPGSPFAMLPQ